MIVLLVMRSLDELVKIKLEGNHNLIDIHGLARLGVNLAHPAQHGTARKNLGGTARLQEVVALALGHAEAHLRDAQLLKKFFDNALTGKEAQLSTVLFQV